VKKISATILDFAKPVLDELPPGIPFETRREVLGFAILVWNALVMVEWGRPDFLAELRERLDTLAGNDIVTGAFDRLVEQAPALCDRRPRRRALGTTAQERRLRVAVGRGQALTVERGTARTYA
jgi:hypothetical protein